jgi:hypothetical protein
LLKKEPFSSENMPLSVDEESIVLTLCVDGWVCVGGVCVVCVSSKSSTGSQTYHLLRGCSAC